MNDDGRFFRQVSPELCLELFALRAPFTLLKMLSRFNGNLSRRLASSSPFSALFSSTAAASASTTPTTPTTTEDSLRGLLGQVADKEVSLDHALERLRKLDYEEVGRYAKVDHHRTLRTGIPEVIFAEGKTVPHIADIMGSLRTEVRRWRRR